MLLLVDQDGFYALFKTIKYRGSDNEFGAKMSWGDFQLKLYFNFMS